MITNLSLLPPGLPAAQIVACIGLIADTHMPDRCAALPVALFDVLGGVDLLLHAGDVGELWVLDRLSTIAPVIAVHGNDDTVDAQRELPYQQVITIRSQRILLTHAHYPDRAQELASRKPDAWELILQRRAAMGHSAGASIVVFGHTHVPMMCNYDGVWLVNPGAIASGNYITRQTIPTVALLFLCDGEPPLVHHINLAAPEQPIPTQIDYAQPFSHALAHFSASILAPDLEAVWAQLKNPEAIPPAALNTALLRVAHRCWAGDQSVITKADLLHELQVDVSLSPAVRERGAQLLG